MSVVVFGTPEEPEEPTTKKELDQAAQRQRWREQKAAQRARKRLLSGPRRKPGRPKGT